MLVLSPAWLGGLIQMPVCEGAGLRTQVATRSPSISRWWTISKMPRGVRETAGLESPRRSAR